MTSSSPGDRGRFHYESAPYTDGGTSGHPVVNVQWRDGGTNDGVEREADSVAEAAVDVAELVAHGFIEAHGIYWPTCPAHGRPSTATVATGPRAVWLSLDQLARP